MLPISISPVRQSLPPSRPDLKRKSPWGWRKKEEQEEAKWAKKEQEMFEQQERGVLALWLAKLWGGRRETDGRTEFVQRNSAIP